MKSKFEKESQDLDAEAESLRHKSHRMREEIASMQEAAIVTKANIKQLEVELKEVKTVTDMRALVSSSPAI